MVNEHALRPLFDKVTYRYVVRPLRADDALPHGLSQVGIAEGWYRADVTTLGTLMDQPGRYLAVVQCSTCVALGVDA